MARFKWKILNKLKTEKSPLRQDSTGQVKLKIEEIITLLLENRGIKTKKEKEEFLDPKLSALTLESAGIEISEVKKTIDRIKTAIEQNEKIIIYGDYDVDGICGTAILWETIFQFYKNVMPYIPHRVDEGYGLSTAGILNIKNQISNNGLIITVDNGIVANKAVDFARENGFDVIITDHHVSSDKAPAALAIIHTTKLCGSGVAYLLAQAISNFQFPISNKFSNDKFKNENDHLELVALATVADLVPLTGANRALVKFGIESLRKTKRPGLLAIFDAAQIRKETIGTYEIGHIIAPRLNATGRITHALDSLRLICTKDAARAKKLAVHLSETNKNRQILTQESTVHADSITEISSGDKFIFVADENYNQGIIGLVASRLVEKHYKPAIAVSIGEKLSKGSARSVKGFNIIEFLRTFDGFLVDAGGHPMAAGFTIETSKIEEFKSAIIKSSTNVISANLLERSLNIDMEIGLDSVNLDLHKAIQALAPFGMSNHEPLFLSRNILIENLMFVGQEKQHLKLLLSEGGRKFEAILFGAAETSLKIGDKIDAVYLIERDDWNGNSKIVLKIKDVEFNSVS